MLPCLWRFVFLGFCCWTTPWSTGFLFGWMVESTGTGQKFDCQRADSLQPLVNNNTLLQVAFVAGNTFTVVSLLAAAIFLASNDLSDKAYYPGNSMVRIAYTSKQHRAVRIMCFSVFCAAATVHFWRPTNTECNLELYAIDLNLQAGKSCCSLDDHR